MKKQHDDERAKMKAQKEALKTGASAEVVPSPSPEPVAPEAPAYDSKHSAEWNAKHNKATKLASKHSAAWNAAHHTAAKAPKAVSLVGDSIEKANRMEMRKAEMAKVQEQHQAEREKMKAQKEAARAAEKQRKDALKGGAVEPSPSPAPEED